MPLPDVRGQGYLRAISTRTHVSGEDSPVDAAAAPGAGLMVPRWTLGYRVLDDHEALFAAYHEAAGAWAETQWFDWLPTSRNDVAIGTGDGVTTTFTLPVKESTAQTIFVNAVEFDGGGVDYSISAGTGTDGEDRAVFNVAPPNGHAIVAHLTGRQRWNVRFAKPNMNRVLKNATLRAAVQFEIIATEGYTPATPALTTVFPATDSTTNDMRTRYETTFSQISQSRTIRFRRQLLPRHDLSRSFTMLSDAEAEAILDHQIAVGGRLDSFYLFDNVEETWKWVRIGNANGTPGPYTLPGRETSAQVVHVNGAVTAGTISYGSGTNLEDRFTAGAGVTSGARMSVDFTGKRRWLVRYDHSDLDFMRDPDSELWSVALRFREVKSGT